MPRAHEVRRLALTAVTEADEAEWRRLAAGAEEPNPFFEPELLLPAARHLGGDDVELLTISDGDGWLLALPVARAWRYHRFPGPCVAGWVHHQCFLGLPLVRAGAAGPAAGALLDSLDVPWLALPRVPLDAALVVALRERVRHRVVYRRSRPVWHGSGPAGSALLSARTRSETRRRARRLGDELGGAAEVTESDGRDPAGLAEFLALEDHGWKHDAGTSLAAHPGDAAFFGDAAGRLGPRLRLWRLAGGGRTVAMAVAIRAGDAQFLFKTAYDESLARFAPGRLLASAAIDALAGAGAGYVDSCATSDSTLASSLLPEQREFATLAAIRPGPAAPVYHAMLGALAPG